MPRLSVAIPAYNYGRYLPCAIRSVLDQGHSDLELLIVDDCSTDDTAQRIAPFLNDPRVRYLKNERNLGAVKNINKAISETRGDFIQLLGADDFILPGSLAAQVAALEAHPEAGFAYGTYVITDEKGQFVSTVAAPGYIPAELPPWRDDFPFLLVHDDYIHLGATLFRRDVIEHYGVFDPVLTIDDVPGRFFRATDWDMCLRLSLCGVKSTYVNSPLSAFRVHSSQASGDDDFYREGIRLRETLLLLERYCSPANIPRLLGHEHGIYRHLQAKKAVYQQYAVPGISGDPAAITAAIARIEAFLADLARRPGDAPLAEPPTVSVIVVARDDPHELIPTLESLAAQSWERRQVLLVNRGRLNLAPLCPDGRYLALPGCTPAEARSWAAQLTDGEILCFIEAGSVLEPRHLESLAGEIARGALAVQAPDQARDHPEVGRESAAWQGALTALLPAGHPWRPGIPTLASFALRRHLFYRAGGFDLTLPVLDDFDFLLRLQRHFPIVRLGGEASVASPTLATAMLRSGAEHGDPEFALRHLKAIAERLLNP